MNLNKNFIKLLFLPLLITSAPVGMAMEVISEKNSKSTVRYPELLAKLVGQISSKESVYNHPDFKENVMSKLDFLLTNKKLLVKIIEYIQEENKITNLQKSNKNDRNLIKNYNLNYDEYESEASYFALQYSDLEGFAYYLNCFNTSEIQASQNYQDVESLLYLLRINKQEGKRYSVNGYNIAFDSIHNDAKIKHYFENKELKALITGMINTLHPYFGSSFRDNVWRFGQFYLTTVKNSNQFEQFFSTIKVPNQHSDFGKLLSANALGVSVNDPNYNSKGGRPSLVITHTDKTQFQKFIQQENTGEYSPVQIFFSFWDVLIQKISEELKEIAITPTDFEEVFTAFFKETNCFKMLSENSKYSQFFLQSFQNLNTDECVAQFTHLNLVHWCYNKLSNNALDLRVRSEFLNHMQQDSSLLNWFKNSASNLDFYAHYMNLCKISEMPSLKEVLGYLRIYQNKTTFLKNLDLSLLTNSVLDILEFKERCSKTENLWTEYKAMQKNIQIQFNKMQEEFDDFELESDEESQKYEKNYNLPVISKEILKQWFLCDIRGQDPIVETVVNNLYVYLSQSSIDIKKERIFKPQKFKQFFVGPTGSGKTSMILLLKRIFPTPFIHVNAIDCLTKLQQEKLISDLVVSALIKNGFGEQWPSSNQIPKSEIQAAKEFIRELVENSVIFIDEIDKLNKPEQYRLLQFLEDQNFLVKPSQNYPTFQISTQRINFMFAGNFEEQLKSVEFSNLTFQNFQEHSGLTNELFGRMGSYIKLNTLTPLDYADILMHSLNSNFFWTQQILKEQGINYDISVQNIQEIIQFSEEKKTGARALSSVMQEFSGDIVNKHKQLIANQKQ